MKTKAPALSTLSDSSFQMSFFREESVSRVETKEPSAEPNTAIKQAPYIFSKSLSPATVTPVYECYWEFAVKRQDIFFCRVLNETPPWTDDPILADYKFTNAYRASDRVSQYLIRNVIYRDDLPKSTTEVFFRTILFKLFNKIETWEFLERKFGALTYENYDFREYDRALQDARKTWGPIYSAAYIMPPGGGAFGHDLKHQNHLKLLDLMVKDQLPLKLAEAKTMQQAFELIKSYPTIGDFLAYQFVTDINYSEITDFSEREFVVPGPGALDGISKCFADTGGLNEPEIIKFMADNQEKEFERLGLNFKDLWGRSLQLIDCQNLFCEISKYSRVAFPEYGGKSGRTRIKQKYRPTRKRLRFWYPPKWGLNKKISSA